MLPVSNSLSFFENFEWELADHPMGMMMSATIEEQQTLESFDFFDYPLLQDHGIDGRRGDSPPLSGAGSGDDHDLQLLLTKKRKNHNESERDRRKKIMDCILLFAPCFLLLTIRYSFFYFINIFRNFG